MKNALSAFAFRVALLLVALAAVSVSTSTASAAQTRLRAPRPVVMMPAFVVAEPPLASPTLTTTASLNSANSCAIAAALHNSVGSITLPDGSVHVLSRPDSDDSIVLPDGTTATPNNNGTFTLPDGHIVDRAELDADNTARTDSGS
jgi:hypothetical protein